MPNLTMWNYNNSEVRTVTIDNEPWWVLKDICAVLEMGTNRAGEIVKRLEKDEYDSIGLTDSLGRKQNTYIVNESGLYSVILRSDKPQAKPFRKWVTSEVLPAIRKHGAYSVPKTQSNHETTAKLRAEAMLLNAQYRMLKLLVDKPELQKLSPVAMETLGIKATEAITGANLGEYLPEVPKTYSATEVGNAFGISAQKVGKIANTNNLKTEEYGIFVMDKSRYSSKEVQNFRYNEKGKAKIKELLGGK